MFIIHKRNHADIACLTILGFIFYYLTFIIYYTNIYHLSWYGDTLEFINGITDVFDRISIVCVTGIRETDKRKSNANEQKVHLMFAVGIEQKTNLWEEK